MNIFKNTLNEQGIKYGEKKELRQFSVKVTIAKILSIDNFRDSIISTKSVLTSDYMSLLNSSDDHM